MVEPVLFTTILALGGVAGAVLFLLNVNRQPTGPDSMVKVWRAIRQGSNAYLKRQFRTILIISVVLAILVFAIFAVNPPQTSTGRDTTYGIRIALAFFFGVATSLLSAYISMDASTRANVRSAFGADQSTLRALRVAISGGATLGLSVVSMSLLGLSLLYILFRDPGILAGFAFGASLAALFAQLGGGIFTKSADVGADLVGKVEAGIPEDDPRNPAVIADLVGDNVGDCAGRGADLFESVTAENVGGMIIGFIIFLVLEARNIDVGVDREVFILIPLIVRAIGVLATYAGLGTAMIERKFRDPMKPLRDGLFVTAIVAGALLFVATFLIFGSAGYPLYGAMLTGLLAGLLIVLFTELYTGSRARPVIGIANSSQSGPALTIVKGVAVGMQSTGLPIITVSAAILLSFLLGQSWASGVGLPDQFLGGIYGTTMATMGMLSVAGMILTMDGVGPIVDNAGGIVEMSGAEETVRERIEPLDALGNTTKALTKGYAMGSAALAALLLFQAFVLEVARFQAGIFDIFAVQQSELERLIEAVARLGNSLALNSVPVVFGAFIGAMLPFLFSGTAISAVGTGAYRMVEEVRRQFKQIPGLMEGTALPDYATCVDISTRSALRLMVVPGILAILAPLLVGYLLGWPAVGAMVVGATISAVPLAITMMWGGGALDNAKKYVEAGNLGGKGSPAHAATVVGDTFGDPLKDTAGPSLHILIKLLNTISLVFIPLFMLPLLSL